LKIINFFSANNPPNITLLLDNFVSGNGKTLLAKANETAILQVEAIDPYGDSVTFSLEDSDSIPGVMVDPRTILVAIVTSSCLFVLYFLLRESVKMCSKKKNVSTIVSAVSWLKEMLHDTLESNLPFHAFSVNFTRYYFICQTTAMALDERAGC